MPRIIDKSSKIFTKKYIFLITLIPLLLGFATSILFKDFNFQELLSPDAVITAPDILGISAPNVMSFQGRLTDRSDTPITLATSITFKIYNVPSAGTALWSGTCTLTPDNDGIFNALLGSQCGSAIPDTVFGENVDTYLGITVGTDTEMTPRQKIVASAYALNADTLDGFDSSQAPGINNVVVLDTAGNLAFGVTNPVISSSGDIVLSPVENLGVGTTNPLFRTHIVQQGVTAEASSVITGGDTGKALVIQGSGGAFISGRDVTNDVEYMLGIASGTSVFMGSATAHNLSFRTNSIDRIVILGSNGYIGIGDTSPASLFTVGSGDLFQVDSTGDLIKIKNVTYTWPSSNVNGVLTNNGSGTLTWAAASGATAWDDIGDPDASSSIIHGAYTTEFTYDTFTSGSAFKLSSASTAFTGSIGDITLSGSNAANTGNLLTLNNTGTLNTGTTFLINHYATGTNNLAFRVNDESADTTPFVIDGNGRVGVGTTTPSVALNVVGDLLIGSATTGTITATKELILRQDGDTYGSSIFRLRNRDGENGAIFETTNPTITLIDFIFKTSLNQRNIRFESRAGNARVGNPSFHIGGASIDSPTFAVGDSYAAVSNKLAIGSYGNPSTLLQLGAGGNAGTLGIAGSSSGLVTINTAATAGTWTMTLPTSAGTNGQVLTTNGSGVLTFQSISAGSVAWDDILGPDASSSIAHGAYSTEFTYNTFTSGSAFGLSSTSTAFTGSLGDITLSGSNAANTGNLLSLNNTGILNTNTTLLLNHYATGTGNLAFRVNDESADTTPFVIDGNGRVGVGTDTPTSYLDVMGATTSTSSLRLRAGTTPTSPEIGDIYSNGTSAYYYNGSEWKDITAGGAWTISGNNIYYTSGNVGIGTNNPEYALDVNSGTNDNLARFSSIDDFAKVYIADHDTTSFLATNNQTLSFGMQYDEQSSPRITQDGTPLEAEFNSDGTKMYVVGNGNDRVYQYSLPKPWNINSASYDSVFLYVGTQDSEPNSIAFNPNGTIIYMTGDATDKIYQYTLSTAWDLSTATYASKFLYVGWVERTPLSITFDDNGDVMYLTGNYMDSVYKFNLSTPWDITTATLSSSVSSYASAFSVNAQDGLPNSVAFNTDGTIMYVTGESTDKIYQYSLSTAWNTSTASYTSKFLSVTSQDTGPSAVTFNSTGTVMYLIGRTNDRVYQYTLSTAWDITTATYSSNSFLVSAQETEPRSIKFDTTGTNMYILGMNSDRVSQYTLSTAWDITTASLSKSFLVSTQETAPNGIVFNSTGNIMFITGYDTDKIYQYTLSTPWDVSTASYTSKSFSLLPLDGTPLEVDFNSNGTKMYAMGYDSKKVYEYNLSTPWDLTTNYFSVTAQETDPRSVKFNTSGTNMYIVGIATDTVYQYSLSTAWDLTTSSLSKSLSVAAQETAPTGVTFNATGKIMFIIGPDTDKVYQYYLSTAWDLGTVFRIANSSSVLAQDGTPIEVAFSSNGTKMYVMGYDNDRVYQYSLSKPWDINSASYDSVFLSVGAQDSLPTSISFNLDGTIMYMTGEANDKIYQYTLSTAWDLSTATYASKFLYVGWVERTPLSITFDDNGDVMYLTGNVMDNVYKFNLSTPWDISTAALSSSVSYSSAFPVNSQDGAPNSVAFNNNGTIMYMTGDGNNTIYQYTLSTAWNTSTATYASKSLSVTSQEGTPRSVAFNSTGTAMYLIGSANKRVFQYALSTAWDISTATYSSNSFLVSAQEADPRSVKFNSTGTSMYIVGIGSDTVRQYSLSTAWDITTAALSNSFSVATQDNAPTGVTFSASGNKMFIIGESTDKVYQYTLSTAWDITTATYSSKFLPILTLDGTPLEVDFNSNGTKMYVMGYDSKRVYEYNLSTPWDLTTSYFSVSAQETDPRSVKFNTTGTSMYIVGIATDTVYQYSLSTAWDLTTATLSKSLSVAAQETAPNGVAFNSSGTTMYIVGQDTDRIYQYKLSTSWNISTASTSYDRASMFINSFGNVGIGIDNPTAYIDIAESTSFKPSLRIRTGVEPTIGNVGDIYSNGSTLLYYNGSEWIDLISGAWRFNGNDLYYNAGKVGIGTTSPTTALDVNGLSHFYSDGTLSSETLMEADRTDTYFDEIDITGNILSLNRDYTYSNVGNANIELGNYSSMYSTQNVTSFTHTHETVEGSNKLLLVQVGIASSYSPPQVTSMTYNGVSLTKADNASGPYVSVNVWYLVNPTVGTHDLVVNTSFSAYGLGSIKILAITWLGVDQNTPLGNIATVGNAMGGSSSVEIASMEGEIVVNSIGVGGAITSGAGQIDIDVDTSPLGTSYKNGESPTTMTWSWSGFRWWSSISVSLRPYTDAEPLNIFGDLASFSSDCTSHYGVCVDISNILKLSQNYNAATGAVLNIENLGTGADILFNTSPILRMADGGTMLWDDGTNTLMSLVDNGTAGALSVDALSSNTIDVIGELSANSILTNYLEVNSGTSNISALFSSSTDLTKVYIANNDTTSFIASKDQTMSFGLQYDESSSSRLTQDGTPTEVAFSSDGTKMYLMGNGNDRVYQYTLSKPWNVSTASYDSVSFHVGTQDSNPHSIAFNTSGNIMYMTGEATDTIYQYTLSTAWNLSTTTYASKSLYVGWVERTPLSITFDDDGNVMFLTGNYGDNVYKFNLSTPWDISTGTLSSSVSYSSSILINAQDGAPNSIAFSSDGTTMYMTGDGNNTIYQYTLSTAWNLSTATYASKSLSVTSQDGTPRSVTFDSTGTIMYLIGSGNDRVYQYTLSTAWDISTATYSTNFFSVSAQETDPRSVKFNSTGTSMYIVGINSDTVRQYTLSTAWDVTTATITNSFSVATQDTAPTGVTFNDSGNKMFIIGEGTDKIYQYTLSTAWDVSTATYTSKSFSILAFDGTPLEVAFNSDGTKMYVMAYDSKRVYEYNLSTPWDITTNYISIGAQETDPRSVKFNTTGTSMYVVGIASDTVYQYALSTAWDLTTATLSISLSVAAQDTAPAGVTFNTSGTLMYIIGYNTDKVHKYTLSTPWDLSTASRIANSFSVLAQDNSSLEVEFNSDGTKMFVMGYDTDRVYQYSLSSPWDVNSASYDSVFLSVGTQDSLPTSIRFNTDGTIMYMTGDTNDKVYQYTLSTPWNLSTATYASKFLYVGWVERTPLSITFDDDGNVMYLTGNFVDNVYKFNLSTPWDISTGTLSSSVSYSLSLLVNAQDSAPNSIAFNNDGTIMYVTGDANDRIYQYTLSTPWNTSTATYASKSLYVGWVERTPLSITFDDDGNVMFLTGNYGDSVYKFNLSTSWDISTATLSSSISYSSSLLVSAQDTYHQSIAFNPNGTIMYLTGDSTNAIYQYTLSTAWNTSTATYASKSLSVTSQDGTPRSVTFDSTGTIMYLMGGANDRVYQYTLSTAWDISTATYSSNSFLVSAQETEPRSVKFDTTGTSMYILGMTSDRVHQYTLSTAWDITTASYASKSFLVSSQETAPNGVTFNPTGTTMFITGHDSDKVYQYTLSTAWDVSTATYTSNSSTMLVLDTYPLEVEFSSDGTKMYIVGHDTDRIYEYNLSTPWNISTNYISIGAQETDPRSVKFNSTGTSMYIVGINSDTVRQYTLSTAWDLTTASLSKSLSVASQDTAPTGVTFSASGNTMHIMGSTTDKIYQYTLSTAWDVSTATYTSNSFPVLALDATPLEVVFNSDGTKMYVMGWDSKRVYEYNLSTPWDISTDYLSIATQETDPRSLKFNPAGTSMYIVGIDSDTVRQYTLSTAWDITTASLSKSLSVASQETAPTGITFNVSGNIMYIIGYDTDKVYQYTLSTPWDISTSSTSYDRASLFINSYGNVGIGTSNPTLALDVIGSGRFSAVSSGTYASALNITSDGTLTTSTSDARLKTNVEIIDGALDKVKLLRGVYFNWTDPEKTGRMTGMIAQEVMEVMPELVFQNKVDGYYGINYGEATGLLIEAIKEQQRQIEALSLIYDSENLDEFKLQLNAMEVLKITLDDKGNIELLGGKIILEGDGALSIRKLRMEENYSIGSSKILANQTSVIITTKAVTEKSKIFVNPTSNTKNKTLYATDRKVGESFVVNINEPIDEDITFDWIIIDSKTPLEENQDMIETEEDVTSSETQVEPPIVNEEVAVPEIPIDEVTPPEEIIPPEENIPPEKEIITPPPLESDQIQ